MKVIKMDKEETFYSGEEILDLCSKGEVDGNNKCWKLIKDKENDRI